MATNISYSHKDKIEIVGNKAYVTLVTIDNTRNPAKTLRLLVDTGAFIALISKKLANDNGYKIHQQKGCIISGFSEKGLVCDLRKIPSVVFCGFRIDDVLIATPHYDDISVTDVLGMNILENFSMGMDFAKEEIYLNARGEFTSQKPKYQSGNVSLFEDIS